MEVLSGHLKNIKVPCGQDNVYKDECVYSYDTPVREVYILCDDILDLHFFFCLMCD